MFGKFLPTLGHLSESEIGNAFPIPIDPVWENMSQEKNDHRWKISQVPSTTQARSN